MKILFLYQPYLLEELNISKNYGYNTSLNL